MNKLVAAFIGSLLMSAGLVASGGSAAQADPYPGTIATTTTVSAPASVKKNKKVRVCATVTVKSGTGTPVGTVTITVTRNAGGFAQSASYAYYGGQVCLKTAKLRKLGGYVATATYVSSPGSVFVDSSGSRGFDVIKKKRH